MMQTSPLQVHLDVFIQANYILLHQPSSVPIPPPQVLSAPFSKYFQSIQETLRQQVFPLVPGLDIHQIAPIQADKYNPEAVRVGEQRILTFPTQYLWSGEGARAGVYLFDLLRRRRERGWEQGCGHEGGI